MRLMTILAAVFFLGACASAPHRALKIQPGMSRTEVTEVAGEPMDRSFIGNQERWVYESNEPGMRKIVTFRGGKVVGFDNDALPQPGATTSAPVPVIPATGPIPDLPCADRNQFGSFAEGGGCNMYGCFPPGGYCNNWGCSAQGTCTSKKCPRPIDTYRCVE